MKNLLRTALAFLLYTTFNHSTAYAQGTAFSYQGHLSAGGAAANGNYDFRFRLASDPLADNYVGSAYLTNAVPVTNGLFSTTIDFGGGIFTGSNYWLEVDVRTNSSNGTGLYTDLAPLQSVTPTPYAVFANTASNLSGTVSSAQISGAVLSANLSGIYNNAVTLNNAGNSFNGSFAGNGASVSNVNAATLSGVAATNFWQLNGNNVSTSQILGSTNNQTLQIVAGGQRALLLIPDTTGSGAPNMIGGSPVNYINSTARGGPPHGSIIIGGGSTNDSYYGQAFTNSITASYSTIAGGGNNTISLGYGSGQSIPDFSFIGGGYGNTANDVSVVGGGWGNTAGGYADYAAVVGGNGNKAAADGAFVGGGGYDSDAQNRAVIAGNSANDPVSVVVGGAGNSANNFGAFVGGGGDDGSGNVGGNTAGGVVSAVVGGFGNTASGAGAFVGGGGDDENYIELGNTAGGGASVVVGGIGNNAAGDYSFIGGGQSNTNTGIFATIPGGEFNIATNYSFAAGSHAQATNQGAFVWADSQNAVYASTNNDSFNVRAQGGVHLVTSGAGMTLDGRSVFSGNNGGGLTNLNASQLLSIGNENFFVGPAGNATTTGAGNTAEGYQAFLNNTSGSHDTAIGLYALFSNTTGYYNTALGLSALYYNTNGVQNTAVGVGALSDNTSGSNNIALGYLAGVNNTTGSSNIDIGNFGASTDNNIIRIGTPGIQTNTIIAGTVYGDGGGLTNLNAAQLTGTVPLAQLPTAVVTNNAPSVSLSGTFSGNGSGLTDLSASQLVSMGNFDFFIGSAGNLTDPGEYSTAIGVTALRYATGFYNTAVGYDALNADTTGGNNTAVGANALGKNVSGFYNTAYGSGSLDGDTNGSYSTAIGWQALLNITNSTYNIALGYQAGLNITGSSNIDIGNTGVAGENDIIRIGTSQTATYIAGNVYASGAVFSNGVDLVSDRNAKEHFTPVSPQTILDKVTDLPITEWNYKTAKDVEHIGPMAQDFHAAFGLDGPDDKHISVVDEGGVALAAIQGLNEKLNEKDAQIADLEARLDKLEQLVGQKYKDGH